MEEVKRTSHVVLTSHANQVYKDIPKFIGGRKILMKEGL
jgi:hypothetical protein